MIRDNVLKEKENYLFQGLLQTVGPYDIVLDQDYLDLHDTKLSNNKEWSKNDSKNSQYYIME